MSRAYGNATAPLRCKEAVDLVRDVKRLLFVALFGLLLVGQLPGKQFELFSTTSTWSADYAVSAESCIGPVIESVSFLLLVFAGVWTWTREWAGCRIDGLISDHVRRFHGNYFVNGNETMSIIPFIRTSVILLGMKLTSELPSFAFDETRFWPMVRSMMILLTISACVWMRMHKRSDSRSDVPISDSAGRSGDRRSASHASPRKTRSLCKRIFIIAACIAACLHGIAMKTASVSCDKFGCARQSGFGLSVSELGPSTAISGVESGCALMDHDFPGTACSSCDSTCSMISGVETSPPQVSDNAHWIKFARIDSLHWIGRQIVVRTCEDVADKFEMTPGKNGACVQWNSFFSICRNFLKRPLRLLLPIVAVNFVHGGGMLGLLVPIAIVVVNEMIDWCCTGPTEHAVTFGKPRMLEPAYSREVPTTSRRTGRLKNKRSLPRNYRSVDLGTHMTLLCKRIAADVAYAFVGYGFSTIIDSRFLLIALCSCRVAYDMITRGHSRGLLESAKFLIPVIHCLCGCLCPGLHSSTEAQMCVQYLSGVVMVDAALFLWANFRFVFFCARIVTSVSLLYFRIALVATINVFHNFVVDISGKSWSAETLLAACLSVFWEHLVALPFRNAECLSLVAVVSICFGLIIGLALRAFRSSDDDAVVNDGPGHSSRQKRCLADETRNLEQAKLDGAQSCQGAYSGALPRVIYSSSAGVGYPEPTAEADQAAADPGHTAVVVEEIPSIEEHQAPSCHLSPGTETVPRYSKGTSVWYRDSAGALQRARVLASHQDDLLEPYYSIRLPDGREKQTDNAHIRLTVEEFDDANRHEASGGWTAKGNISPLHLALVMACCAWKPSSFVLKFLGTNMFLGLCQTSAGPIKGSRHVNWRRTAIALLLLFVGAESAGGVGGTAGVQFGDVVTSVVAVTAAVAVQNKNKPHSRLKKRPIAEPYEGVILGAVDEIYDGVEDMDAITVGDVMKRIAKRFGWEECPDDIRSLVKRRLSDLVNGEVPMPSRAWTEWRDQLETVEIEGTLYRVVEIEGDGNCFLRALSIALYYDEGARHHDLRRMMVQEMRHPRFRQIYSNGGYLDYETRCDDMGNWGEYIEHPEILALSTLLQIHFVIYDERNKDNLIHVEPADGSPTPGPPITFRLTNANSEAACHYELLVEDSEQDWSRFYSSFYTSAFCEVADSIYEDEKLGESASSYDSKSDDSCSIADDDNDDDYVEESVHRDCGRKGRTKKAAASKRKAATSHSDSSHGKRARTKKNPPDHKPSTKKMCTDPEPEEFLDPCDRESDFWFLGDCQCPEKILEELRSLEQNGPAKKIEDGKKRLQKLLLEHSKFLDREDLSEEQIEESFNKFKKDLAELISELCPEYSNRLNFGQALSELTELLVVLHYAPDSDKDFKKGTCTFDKMPPGSNCLAWLLKVVPKALNEEAGGTGMSAESLKRVAECVTMVDLRPIIPVSKKKCLSEFNTVRNGLGLTHGKFDLIGHLLVAYHAKFFQALKKNKERQLPVLAGSYLVNARMYNESGRVTSSAVRKEGCIAHPECWLAGYIGNSIIYSIDDYEEFGRALSRAFGHVAKVVDGFQVPQESRIGLRYGGLEDMTEAELKELREVLREMRARIGRKRTRAAEMYAICMHDGQSHDGAMDTIREELGDSYANLLQGSFDGGATTGKMITKAFKTYNECVDNEMTHEDAIKEVENRHGPKHANLVRGSFEGGALGGATTGKMISDAFDAYYECIGVNMTHDQAIKEVKSVHGTKHANLVQGCFDGGALGGATTGKMVTEAFKAHAKAIEENKSYDEAIDILRKNYGNKHANLFTSSRKNLRLDELARAMSAIDEYSTKPEYSCLSKLDLAKKLKDEKVLKEDEYNAYMERLETLGTVKLDQARSAIDKNWATPAYPGLTKYELATKLLEEGNLESDLHDAFMLHHEKSGKKYKGKDRVPYRCRHRSSDGTQCTAIVKTFPGSKPAVDSDFYIHRHTCNTYCNLDSKMCNAVPGKGQKSNNHWTKNLEDSADAGDSKKLEKAMKNSNKITLGVDAGLFQCKLEDGAGNQCECCFKGRYGTKQPLMTRHRMSALHTCEQWKSNKDKEKFRMTSGGKYALPDKVEGGFAENEYWKEIPEPENFKYFAKTTRGGRHATKSSETSAPKKAKAKKAKKPGATKAVSKAKTEKAVSKAKTAKAKKAKAKKANAMKKISLVI